MEKVSKQVSSVDKRSSVEKGLRVMAAVLIGSAAFIACNNPAYAIATPAAGSTMYNLYDIAVVQLLQGPLGFVGGVGCIVLGAINVFKHPVQAVPAILAGGCMLKADQIVTSLGMTI